jgi:hypothetical protein
MSEADTADRRTLAWVALALVVAMVGSFGHAGYRYSKVDLYERAPAVIVEIDERRGTGSQSSTQRVPVAELSLGSGETVRVPLEASSNSPFCCDLGEKLEVLYDPSDLPGTALANRFGDLYGPQLLFGVVAGLFLLFVGRGLFPRRSS